MSSNSNSSICTSEKESGEGKVFQEKKLILKETNKQEKNKQEAKYLKKLKKLKKK